VAEPIFRRPFKELDAYNDEQIKPTAYGHFCERETFAPAALTTVRQVCEWTALRLQLLEVLQQDPAEFGLLQRFDEQIVNSTYGWIEVGAWMCSHGRGSTISRSSS
jgi:hypothetical protein